MKLRRAWELESESSGGVNNDLYYSFAFKGVYKGYYKGHDKDMI